ncbi:MAG: CoA pyrophosphatase [Betaproteobacteria bacterium]|nr:CoA pyrophosphatase [Betaproteobacteria bacterium]MBI2960682.1 CoA pyrophosphatase [Betaproteobacteria bacterium]
MHGPMPLSKPDCACDEAWLRRRFAGSRRVPPLVTGDGRALRRREEIRPAAVLVPVISRDGGLTLLLTRRTAHLYDHAAQISFPGGRAEADESPQATALRETEEEIGLPASQVHVLGTLSEYVTVTGYCVTPVVGLVQEPFELRPDEFEVAEIFEVPLAFFLDPANHLRNSVKQQGIVRHYYAMPYRQYYIWGATAGMLMNFYAFLTA